MKPNTTPKTRTIDGNKSLDSLFPSRFLKADNLIMWEKTSITVTIAKIVEEEVTPQPGKTEWKPVIYFKNRGGDIHHQGYLLTAKTDRDALKTATEARTIGELIGKSITIRLDTWRDKTVLRIAPQPVEKEKAT